MSKSQRKTIVVNVRTDEFDVWIGRAVLPPLRAPDARCHQDSPFRNPYRITRDRSRATALAEYEALWRRRLGGKARQLWLSRLRSLEGKRLGSEDWPKPCHGDVLVALLGEYAREEASSR